MCILLLLALFISLCVTLCVSSLFSPSYAFALFCSLIKSLKSFHTVSYLYSPSCDVYFNNPFPSFPCCSYFFFPVYFVSRLFHIIMFTPLCFLLLVKEFSVLLCRITLYDYQAMCRTNKESSDSAHSLLDPYNAFFAAVKWIMTELVLFLVEFNLCSWWHSDLTAKAQRLKQTLEPCDTEYPAFVSERTIKETTGSIACDDCFKSFVIQQIPSSNLFMVVVDNECFCDSVQPITMAPIEIRYNESLKCERLKSQKIRRRPESCHGFHPEVSFYFFVLDSGRCFISLKNK
uniref:Voltage-dependent calcium channel alpha-2/delta subunit conserved region domain-containing protein n=1 Tax=Anas platyrhynchos platyrhynchos TaxID=8840 RepID=A0A493SU38_ANAPP